VDHLYSINILVDYFLSKQLNNVVVVSPDVGGIKMARAYAKRLDAPLAIVDKRRVSDRETQVMNLIGEVKGRDVVIVDDLVSTGGSLVEAVKALKKEGAQKIYAAITHPVLAGSAIEKIENSDLQELVVSNSIPVPKNKQTSKIKVLSIAPLLGEAIRRIHLGESVSSLFSQSPVEA
jgi:ribose-phosphate pyrophosphokinase